MWDNTTFDGGGEFKTRAWEWTLVPNFKKKEEQEQKKKKKMMMNVTVGVYLDPEMHLSKPSKTKMTTELNVDLPFKI